MNNTDNNAACYTFEQLLQQYNIAIPQIQRDYTQGRSDERTTRIRKNFVLALHTAIQNKQNLTLDFVYGNIDKSGTLTLLDGQQRLTTLFLLHWYIAKKTNHDVELLKKFSYEIRPDTRDFCAKLLSFNPFSEPEQDLAKKESKISFEITNQKWFPLPWNKDPSIVSILTMLDEIHAQFIETAVIWEELSRITFYFLALEDMGLTNDLYIKMNSRGKPLTDFEHFKAELDKQLSSLNKSTLANDIRKKFDTTWTDLLWEYRNSGTTPEENTIVDDEFLRYIHFICDVIYYQNEDYYQKKEILHEKWNSFKLLEIFFRDKERIIENFITLQSFFDCWCEANLCKIKYSTPDDFLLSFINTTENYKKNKIVTQIGKNIFQECLARFTVNFNLQQFVFLYAVTYYLQHTDKIKYLDFVRRIRIINNLIQNSKNEISPRRMKKILEHVEEILKTGEVKEKDNTFNKYQLREELEKSKLLIKLQEKDPQNHDKLKNKIFELEDHKLLYGQISILFDFEHIENITKNYIETAYKFISLFKCDSDKIDCALMTIGDYSQKISIEDWRSTQQFGAANQESWKELFHQHDIYTYDNRPDKSKKDFAYTRNILLKFLEDNKEINNDILDTKKNDFIKKCEAKKQYPFEYYYLKYNVFRPAKNGMSGKCFKYDTYSYTILRLKDSHSDNYNPYLKEACHKLNNEGKDNYKEDLFNKHKYFKLGQRGLRFKTHSMEHWYLDNQDLFRIYDKNHNILMPIIINQNKISQQLKTCAMQFKEKAMQNTQLALELLDKPIF